MRYAYVKDGNVIQKNVSIPKNWNNISNFNLLSNEKLKEYGWIPYTFVDAVLDENEILVGTTLTLTEFELIETQQKRGLTQEEINNKYEEETYNLNTTLRVNRNIFLQESDWTQLNDAALSNEKKEQWATYRQALRDLPQNTPDPRNVSWPQKPI